MWVWSKIVCCFELTESLYNFGLKYVVLARNASSKYDVIKPSMKYLLLSMIIHGTFNS